MTLLTTDEYRDLHPSALGDEAIQLLLDAAEADILAFAGPDGARTEWLVGGQRLVALAAPAGSVSSVVEERFGTSLALAVDDYELDPTGTLLYRRGDGTNPRWRWQPGSVRVTYTPASTEDQRKVVQADLVHLTETYSPGVGMTVVGSWTEQYTQAMGANAGERDAILSRLTTRGRMLVVGG